MNPSDNMLTPNTLQGLTEFYKTVYAPLYIRFANEGAVAQELHAEVAAAFDHLICGVESETSINEDALLKAAGHLKRATFDGFKLIFENQI